MTRLLSLASGSLMAASLAVLPISAFAQQTDVKPDAKPAMPMSQGTAAAKTTAPVATTETATPHATATAKPHHVKHAATPADASTSKPAAATPAQPKTMDQSKS